MREISLSAVANQKLSVTLDNRLYDITIKEANGVMAVTIVRDGITIQDGTRAIANSPLIPYRYLEKGNFIILTANGDYPYYTQFGITQFLYYASQTELEEARGT